MLTAWLLSALVPCDLVFGWAPIGRDTRPLSAHIDESSVAFFGVWQSESDAGDEPSSDETSPFFAGTVTVRRPLKGTPPTSLEITTPHAIAEGQRVLLLGRGEAGGLRWRAPVPVSEAAEDYLWQLPELPIGPRRLRHVLPFLEHADPVIAEDAFREVSRTPIATLVDEADTFDLPSLRRWVASPDVSPLRYDLYAVMLGLAGDANDRDRFGERVFTADVTPPLVLGAATTGYLLLAGESGLVELDERRLTNDEATFSQRYAVLQALRFLWEHQLSIPRDRLAVSVRPLTEDADLADLAIFQLQQWRDWSLVETLAGRYSLKAPKVERRAIVRYYLAAAVTADPERQAVAEAKLAELEQLDPEMVELARRFFVP